MRDAIDYMRRNASTIGNISGTESMSAIFRNYTTGNLNGRYIFWFFIFILFLFSERMYYNSCKKERKVKFFVYYMVFWLCGVMLIKKIHKFRLFLLFFFWYYFLMKISIYLLNYKNFLLFYLFEIIFILKR